jgi:uncharacterized SAM-binding protein YcdF (DUF218 family)
MTLPEGPAAGAKKKLYPGCLLWGGLAVILLLSLLTFLRRPILTGAADVLIVNDAPHPADIIFLLNGDFNTRPVRAAELYKQGLAPRVVIARAESGAAVKLGLIPNETDISVGVMKRLGVPAEAITILPVTGGVTSTFDEARVLRDYVEENQVSRIILVTSEFHSRRAKWIFERELTGLHLSLEMAAVPYSTFDRTNWWTNENGLITLNNEYIKFIFYYIKYR